jgi:UDP-N-acetylmuramate--L-alanine ligase
MKLFFIGIAGHAMRGVALAAREQGHTIAGLDETAAPPGSDWLDQHHITWARIPDVKQLDGVDAVIISGGLPADYPLLSLAKQRGIRIMSFAEYLGEYTAGKHVIAVSGTHGKTTTTSLITWLLESAGRRPDYLIGIRPFNFDSSARLTGASAFVVEGDEYVASNLDRRSKVQLYHPDTLVLTSVEHDHPDIFPTIIDVLERFKAIVSALPPDGQLIAWAASPAVGRVAESAPCAVTTYGLETGDFTPRDIAYLPTGIEFDIEDGPRDGIMGRIAVTLYGKHNILNALAAVAVALREGLSIQQIIDGAATFRGAYRRFNLLTEPENPITIVDDYAHHPTEVATTLEAAKLHFKGRRVVAVFRPHTYSRTQTLLQEYRQAFESADLVYITAIEAAREQGQEQPVSGQDITTALTMPALYVPDRAELVKRLYRDLNAGDVVVCMSVSGYDDLAGELAKHFAK